MRVVVFGFPVTQAPGEEQYLIGLGLGTFYPKIGWLNRMDPWNVSIITCNALSETLNFFIKLIENSLPQGENTLYNVASCRVSHFYTRPGSYLT